MKCVNKLNNVMISTYTSSSTTSAVVGGELENNEKNQMLSIENIFKLENFV